MDDQTPFLWVALDGLGQPDSQVTSELLSELWKIEGAWGPKVNLDCVLKHGYRGILALLPEQQKTMPRPMFGDGKTKNGRRTMRKIVRDAAEAGFTHWNFYVDGSDGLGELTPYAREVGLTTMALTQLSHNSELSVEKVQYWTRLAEIAGFDEVIMPGKIVKSIKTRLEIVATGIRPDGPDEHQPHAVHPREMRGVANSVVVGTPIFDAIDPVEALQQHLAWLSGDA